MTTLSRQRSGSNVKHRAKAPHHDPHEQCAVAGCTRPTQRASGNGLSTAYCKPHQEHLRRHGHTTRKGYHRKELEPYREAARRWLEDHRATPTLRRAIMELEVLLLAAGKAERATAARSRLPQDKARIVLARLRETGKTGEQLLEIVLTSLAIFKDRGPRGYPDFRHTLTGKMAKRLRGISGTHIKSEFWGWDHWKFQRAEGAFVRIVGQKIEEAARSVLEEGAVEEVLATVNAGRKH